MSISDLKGDIAEQVVILYLTRNNYQVYKPITKDTAADIIAVCRTDNKLYRLQVKYVTPIEGALDIRAARTNNNSSVTYYKYDKTMLDYIVIYNPDNDQLYFVPIELFETKSNLRLRIEPTKNNQIKGVTWAKDYINLL